MIYQGSCHCGGVVFEVEGDLSEVLDCNCSICQKKGALLWFVPQAAMKLKTPREAMNTYTFNRKVIQHHFCPTCGIHPLGEGVGPDGVAMAAINVRCLDNVDLSSLKVRSFNGRDM